MSLASLRPAIADAVFVDFETTTADGYSLQHISTRRYLADPRFTILGVSIAVGVGDIRFHWAGAKRDADGLVHARLVLEEARDAGRPFVAHNVGFDGMIADQVWGLRFERYFDTAGYCRFLGIGGSLAAGAAFLGKTKLEAPPFTLESLQDPTLLKRMARYCATDTAVCRELFERAVNDVTLPDVEFDVIDQTARMNLRGLYVDPEAVERMLVALRRRRDRELEHFVLSWDFDPTDLQRRLQVNSYLADKFDLRLHSLAKADPRYVQVMETDTPAAAFLKSRAQIIRLDQALKKACALQAIGSGPVKNFEHYYGAHTGRFSGGRRDAEKLNIHGMAKHGDLAEVKLERSIVVPPPGFLFRAADLSNIEARVVAWLAGEEVLLERFRSGDDIYIWFARQIFQDRKIMKGGENGHLRALGKTAVLGLGFGMGLQTFHVRARASARGCSATDVERAYGTYQASFPHIIGLRRQLIRAFERAVRGEHVVEVLWTIRPALDGGDVLTVDLPTGRSLYYRGVLRQQEVGDFGPHIALWYAPRPGKTRTDEAAPAVRADGVRRFADGVVRRRLTPQVLVENVVQAIARDIMVHQALELERRGYPLAFHAHDEIVTLCERCECGNSCSESCSWTRSGLEVAAVMSAVPKTLPRLATLPMACELSDSIRDRYGS